MNRLTDHYIADKGGFYVASSAVVLGNVNIGKGSGIWYGSIVRGDLAEIKIGDFTNIQDNCVLHVDPDLNLEIGNYVSIGHHATVHGKSIGDKTLIGMGAILLGNCKIGSGCIIGAGAVVRENFEVPDRSILVGVPGKIIGTTSDKQVESNINRAHTYHELAQKHLKTTV